MTSVTSLMRGDRSTLPLVAPRMVFRSSQRALDQMGYFSLQTVLAGPRPRHLRLPVVDHQPCIRVTPMGPALHRFPPALLSAATMQLTSRPSTGLIPYTLMVLLEPARPS